MYLQNISYEGQCHDCEDYELVNTCMISVRFLQEEVGGALGFSLLACQLFMQGATVKHAIWTIVAGVLDTC